MSSVPVAAPLHVTAELDQVLRALVAMAKAGDGPSRVVDLIEPGSSIAFLQQALGKLRVHGLVGARRGATGGYWLRRPAAEVTVADVMRALNLPAGDADGTPTCPVDALWRRLDAEVQAHLGATTISDLVG